MEKPMVKARPQVVMTQTPEIKINGLHPKVEMESSLLERSSCVGMKRRIVIETLSIPKAFTVLIRKNPLPFTYLIPTPTWRVFISQMKHHMICLLHPLLLICFLPKALALQLLTKNCCSSNPFCTCWSEQVGNTVHKSRQYRTCECLPHYV